MTERRSVRRTPLAALAALALVPAGAASAQQEVPTFTKDVLPIMQRSCQECHQPGAIGPMSLMTYEEVRPWARAIKLRVETQAMPPYHYDVDVGIQELKSDKRLSPEEIAVFSRWVDGGAPMGDPADTPAPVQWPDAAEWRLAAQFGQPDVVVKSEPFDVPDDAQDLWWQPSVPTGLTEDRCIRAIETKPSVAGRAVTHHANSYFRPEPGADALAGAAGGRGDGRFGQLSEYALGKLGEIIPDDACRVAPANSYVSWDIHYYPNGAPVEDDQVEVGLWLHPEEVDTSKLYRQTLSLYYLRGGDFDIPPHGTLMTQGFHSFETPVRIDSFQPHGHLRLKGKSLEIFYPETGRKEMVSQISNWHPGWHLSHIYQDHVAPLVPKGAVLIITAWYDNTTANVHNPDPDQWVGVGDRTADEMSHAWIAVTHLDQEGYDRLVAEREKQRQERATDEE